MELYHLTMNHRKTWSIAKTAHYFGVSIGLVSENLKLAHALHNPDVCKSIESLSTRQQALDRIR